MIQRLINHLKLFCIIKYNEWEFEKELTSNLNMWFNRPATDYLLAQEDVKQKYHNGVFLLKQKIRREIAKGNDFHTYMSQFKGNEEFYLDPSLINLASDENEEQKRVRLLRQSIIAYESKEETEEDRKNRADARIQHFYTLQKKKQLRELSRKIRHAKQSNNPELYNELMLEFNKLNGRNKSN